MLRLEELALSRQSSASWRTEDLVGILWGELDWLEELHRLLYDYREAEEAGGYD